MENEFYNDVTFIKVTSMLIKPVRIYRRYRCGFVKMEYGEEDTFSTETKKTHPIRYDDCFTPISYDFFIENLSWITKLHNAPIFHGSLRNPYEDVANIFRNISMMNFAILTGDLQFATLFVKYGIYDETTRRNVNRRSYHLNKMQDSLPVRSPLPNQMDGNCDTVMRTEEFCRAKLEIFSFAVYANRCNLFPSFETVQFYFDTEYLLNKLYVWGGLRRNRRGIRRILLISKLLDALKSTTASTRNFEDHIMCLKLYFRTITDPFVCKEEFQEFLSFFFSGMTEDTIQSLTDLYESLFEESVTVFAPRCLKHLSRCTLRSSLLKENCHLPDTVSSLLCPNRLKRYIYGQL